MTAASPVPSRLELEAGGVVAQRGQLIALSTSHQN
jgi:hypothetical protein